MADNLTTQSATPATIPASTVIATDDAGAAGHVQVVKLAVSTDGSATPLTADNTNGLLVNLGANNDVTVTGTVTAQDGGSSLTVDGTVAVSSVGGTVAVTQSGTWDEVGINDSGNSITVDDGGLTLSIDDGAGSLTVDGTVAISGTVAVTDNAGSLTVDGTVAVSSVGGTVAVTDNSGSLTIDNAALSVTGGGVEASALRVTLASDSTGVLSIDDNSGSLTVDGTVTANLAAGTNNIGDVDIASIAAGDTVIGRIKITDGTDVVDVLNLTNSDPLAVAIVDGSGTQITSFGGGTQYTEADTDSTITGTAVMWEDTSDTLRAVSAAKPLPVNVVAGGAGDGSILDGVSSSIKASVLDYTNSNPLAVRLTDTNGDYVGAGAGTQYTEDAAAAADPVGTMAMAVRADTPAAVTTTDGDNIALRATNKGELYVKHLDSIPVTDNSGSLTVDNATLSVTGGGVEASALRVTIASDSTGVLSIDDNGGSLTVDGTVTANLAAGTNNIGDVDILSIAAGDNNIGNVDIVTMPNVTIGTNANLTESLADDAAFTPATSRVLPVGFTFDDVTPDSVNEGDIGAARMSANRNIYTTIRDAAGNERGLNIDASGQIAVTLAASQTLGTLTTLTGGGVAHDGVDSGNPVKVGAKASATLSDDTMVANADRTDLTSDLDGALYVRNVPLGDLIFEAVSNTDGASTAFTNFGATASTRSYVTSITAFRTDTATTMAYIDFRDGTAGSVVYRVPLPPTGGVTINNGGNPLFYTTANTALAFDVSSALTTVYISVTGFKSKARA